MIISLLFEPLRNSSRDHLCFVCAIWHDCIFAGNDRLYTGFWVVLSLSTLYFWLAGKTKTKQVANRMSEWVEGGGSWKGHESGQAVFFLERLSFPYGRNFSAFLKCFLFLKIWKRFIFAATITHTYIDWIFDANENLFPGNWGKKSVGPYWLGINGLKFRIATRNSIIFHGDRTASKLKNEAKNLGWFFSC